MTFKQKNEDQTIRIFNLRADTNEFIGAGDAYIPANTGLPAHSTDIEPPATTEGNMAVFDTAKSKWSLVEDHRNAVVYDINTATEIIISELGELPKNTTAKRPSGPYQKWDGGDWVVDEEATREATIASNMQTKSAMLKSANERIATLQDAVDFDIATEREKELLVEWKKHRIKVSRIGADGYEGVSFPETPE